MYFNIKYIRCLSKNEVLYRNAHLKLHISKAFTSNANKGGNSKSYMSKIWQQWAHYWQVQLLKIIVSLVETFKGYSRNYICIESEGSGSGRKVTRRRNKGCISFICFYTPFFFHHGTQVWYFHLPRTIHILKSIACIKKINTYSLNE